MPKSDDSRFDRAIHLFARHPALAIPFAAFCLALFFLALAPSLWQPSLGPIFASLLFAVLVGIHVFALGALYAFASAWQFRLIEHVEASGTIDARSALLYARDSRLFVGAINFAVEGLISLCAQFLAESHWLRNSAGPAAVPKSNSKALATVSNQVSTGKAQTKTNASVGVGPFFRYETTFNLSLAYFVWNKAAPPKARSDGQSTVKLHTSELSRLRARMPQIPWPVSLGLLAAIGLFMILPQSFMVMPVKWLAYPIICIGAFSGLCGVFDWAEIFLRHREWGEKRNSKFLATKRRA